MERSGQEVTGSDLENKDSWTWDGSGEHRGEGEWGTWEQEKESKEIMSVIQTIQCSTICSSCGSCQGFVPMYLLFNSTCTWSQKQKSLGLGRNGGQVEEMVETEEELCKKMWSGEEVWIGMDLLRGVCLTRINSGVSVPD